MSSILGIFFVPMIVFLTVVAPIWIVFHYITRWRTAKSLTGEDEQILRELWQSAEKFDQRLSSLERILDAESPGWRRKPHD